LCQAYYDFSKVTKDQIAAYAAPLSTPGARHALLETGKQIIPPNIDDLVTKYKEIKVPTLIIWGKQDKIISAKAGELLDQAIPNSTLKVIDQCGHAPQEEEPEQTIALVLEFLKRL
jgi:pimeloyl-ACP methyl ester carboxylesterase